MVYAVYVTPHTGGSIFLGLVQAANPEDAETRALERYQSQSKKQAREIEECGGFGFYTERIS